MLEIFGPIIQLSYRFKVPQNGGFRGLKKALLCKQMLISPVALLLGREQRYLVRFCLMICHAPTYPTRPALYRRDW